jgi:hypothetical protein
MTDAPGPTYALLAVFPDADRARTVADDLAAAGVARHDIRIGSADDETTSLEAEVREETTRSFVAPHAGVVFPKETVKAGIALGGPLTAIGVVLGAIAGAVTPYEPWPIWLRALVGAIVGGTALGAVASIMIPAMSVKNPLDPSVAETGTTLRVALGSSGPDVQRLLAAARPLRLDRLGDDDAPLGTVVTEEDFDEGGIVEEVADSFAREHQADPEERTR